LECFKFLYHNHETIKYVFQLVMIHFLLISTKSKIFQQTGKTISQNDSDSTESYFSGEIETFLFLSEFGIIPNTSNVPFGMVPDSWRIRNVSVLTQKRL
jgi:hypothetical protein